MHSRERKPCPCGGLQECPKSRPESDEYRSKDLLVVSLPDTTLLANRCGQIELTIEKSDDNICRQTHTERLHIVQLIDRASTTRVVVKDAHCLSRMVSIAQRTWEGNLPSQEGLFSFGAAHGALPEPA